MLKEHPGEAAVLPAGLWVRDVCCCMGKSWTGIQGGGRSKRGSGGSSPFGVCSKGSTLSLS